MAVYIRSFCCGYSLRAGSVFAGIFYTVLGLVGAIFSFIMVTYDVSDVADLYALHIIFITAGIICLAEAIVSASLIYAAAKEKRTLVTWWLVINAVIIVLYFATLAATLLITAAMVQGTFLAVFSVISCLLLVVMMYFLSVVFSYKQTLGTAGRIIANGAVGGVYPSCIGETPRPQQVFMRYYPPYTTNPQDNGPYYTDASRPPPYSP